MSSDMAPSTISAIAIHLDIANGQFSAGKLADAANSYRAVLQLDPGNSHALHFLGIIYYQQGDYREAAELIGRAAAFNKSAPHLHFNLGSVFATLNRLDEAVAAFQTAIALNPQYADAYRSLGNALQALGRPDDALTAYRTVAGLLPASAEVLITIGEIAQGKGDLALAVDSACSADRLSADQSSFPHRALGLLAVSCGLTELARKGFREQWNVKPG